MKKCLFTKTSLFTLLLAGLLALSACQNPTGGSKTPDTTTLSSAITTAETLRAGTETSADGTNIAPDQYWAAASAHTALTTAIDAAKGVKNSAAEQPEVNTAVTNLNTAVTAFIAARSSGRKTSGFTAGDLARVVTEAERAKAGAAVSIDGADVLTGEYWVPQSALTALNNAITAAGNVGGTGLDNAYKALRAAIVTFNAAKKLGTRVPTVSITVKNLPGDFANGTMVYMALFTGEISELTGAPDIMGRGPVINGSVTVELFKNNNLWTGNGSYKVAFGNGMDPNVPGLVGYYSKAEVVTYTASSRQQETTYSTADYEPLDPGAFGGQDNQDDQDGPSLTGEITGTITLIGVDAAVKEVQIVVMGISDNLKTVGTVDLSGKSGTTVTNAPWSILLYDSEVNDFPNGSEFMFTLRVSYTDGSGRFIEVPGTKTIPAATANVGDLGTVTL